MMPLAVRTADEGTFNSGDAYDSFGAAANAPQISDLNRGDALGHTDRRLSGPFNAISGSLSDAQSQANVMPVVTPAQELAVAAPMERPRLEHRDAKERFWALYQWEGTVLEIGADAFVARTRDVVDTRLPDEQVTLPVDDVPRADRDLLQVGAVFYWLIGYEETDEGTRKRLSMLRFRRLPGWSKRALERVEAAADDLMRTFGPQ